MSESSKTSSLKVYFRLLSYVKPYWGYFILSIAGLTVFALSQPLFAKLLDYFVQALETGEISLMQQWPWLANSGISATYLVPLLLILVTFFRGIGTFVGSYFLSKLSLSVIHDLRVEMFERMITLPTCFFDSTNSGQLIARITHNVNMVTEAAVDALRVGVREGMTVIFLMGYLLITDWKLTLIFVAVTPLIALIVTAASKRFRRISHSLQTAVGELTQVTSETIHGQREIKGFGGEAFETNRFIASSAKNRSRNLKLNRTSAIHTPLIQFIISIALATLFLVILMTQSGSSTATLIGFVTAAGLLPKPIRQLSEVNAKIQRGLAAAENVFSLMDEEPEKNTGTLVAERVNGRIELKNLSFTYNNADEPALKDLNFVVEPGQTIALVGRSGSGKTTLASLIPRFYELTEGKILVDDTSISDFELTNLRSHIALVSQNVTLFNGTVAENIAYGTLGEAKDEDDIRMAAEAAYAMNFIKDLPDGMHTEIGENGVLLSGGQRQRLAIARAILKDAPILILDEATSALDTESERHIQNALDEVMKGRTTLVIAHRLSTIENADCILVMDKGQILEHGSHEELIAKGGHYARLHQMQFRDEAASGVILEQI